MRLLATDESPLTEISLTVLRVFAGLSMAFGHGLGKMPPSEGFVGAVTHLGFPAPELFAWAASLSEFGGGLLLALGLLTRPAAAGIAFTMAVAAFLAHAGEPYGVKEMALLYLVVGLVYLVRGGGRWSLDQVLLKVRKDDASDAQAVAAK